MDSSRTEVWAGSAPRLEGRREGGASFSTCDYICKLSLRGSMLIVGSRRGARSRVGCAVMALIHRGEAYRDFKIHHLLRPGAHLVVEAEAVLARLFCREDGVELPLFTVLHYYLVVGTHHAVVDVEGAAGLHLYRARGSLSAFCMAELRGGKSGSLVEAGEEMRTAK